MWVCFWSGTWKRIPVDEWTLKIMTVLAYVCVFERVRAGLRVCSSGLLLIQVTHWSRQLAGSGGVHGSDRLRERGPGRVSERRLSARTRTWSTFTQEKNDANAHASPPPVRPGRKIQKSEFWHIHVADRLQSNALAVGFGILKGHKVPFFVVTKTGVVPFKPTEGDKEEIQEANASPPAAKETSVALQSEHFSFKRGTVNFCFCFYLTFDQLLLFVCCI